MSFEAEFRDLTQPFGIKITPIGPPGPSGATFTPSVSENGDLSWTNDKGLPNPPMVNIKGPPGGGGSPGGGYLPPGGTKGQVLAKASDAPNDFEWQDPITYHEVSNEYGGKTITIGGV